MRIASMPAQTSANLVRPFSEHQPSALDRLAKTAQPPSSPQPSALERLLQSSSAAVAPAASAAKGTSIDIKA